MGRPKTPVFQAWLDTLAQTDPSLQHTGRYTLPPAEGAACELSIALEGEELQSGYAFCYHTAGMGPPEEFLALVELALDQTEEWYLDQTQKQRKKR